MVWNKNKSLTPKNYNNSYGMLQNEVNKVFDNFLDIFDFPMNINNEMFIEPKIEVIETDKDIKVSAELPGMDEKDIELNITNDGYLTIKGEKKSSNEEKGKHHYFSERSYGMVQRTIALPNEIDTNKINATFSKGILTIEAPKSEKAKESVRKIEIKSK